MSIATYSELQTAVVDFLNRDDLTSVIPTFITLAEARIARDLRHWRQEKRVTTTLDEGYENLPSDWIEAVYVGLTDGGELRAISTAEMQSRKAASSTAGTPAYYRINAGQIEVYPTPATGVSIDLQYYARIPSLSDTDPVNWLLTYAPDVLLYGTLMQTAPYLAEDARTAIWAGLYQSALDALNDENMKSRVSGPLRLGVPR